MSEPWNDAFLKALQEPRPDPGGGSAAAHGGLMALCLLHKVAALEAKRAARTSTVGRWWNETLQEIRSLAEAFRRWRQDDAVAYQKLAQVHKMEASHAVRDSAATEAAKIPLAIMKTAASALKMAVAIGDRCARHLTADVAVAAEFLGSALHGAFWIALANAECLHDAKSREDLRRMLRKQREEGEETLRVVRHSLKDRCEAGRR
ncbi:cyclodeaminase/cyclohydrolase family protein [Desulfosoma caldarium]|uniref:Formiminotetrahydrofolate cyclodeaminase n=1 Tax=Desulfosoma caldarium TaxID=610254 RepID=A0A3N1UQG5_9BACT|nr:cyclodeaminase/cyclohydrolase family protein [Desulfosoma caldarium]ROQ93354.1 formiminotetrahydrofolate cyclodeaminase [Desulfosoma caldarium]